MNKFICSFGFFLCFITTLIFGFNPLVRCRSVQKTHLYQSSSSSSAQKKLISGILSALLIAGPPAALVTGPPGLVQEAVADFRAQQKRTYFRFIPKFDVGKEFYQTDLKNAIDADKWDVVTDFFKEYVSKYNPNDPTQVDATDTYVNVHLYRPMIVFSGTFAERGTSTKQRALLEQEAAFEAAMGDLEGCIKDRKGSGFFAADIKMPTGAARKKQALDAYARGKEAINEYIKISNNGLMLELNKLKSIP